jgi:uncharacterized repeat protein (TIGR04076 family)
MSKQMKKARITVLKTHFDAELAAEYGIDGLGACPMLKAGQVFYGDYAKPDGFCDEAWKAIYQYVFALSHGAEDSLFYYGCIRQIYHRWLSRRRRGVRPLSPVGLHRQRLWSRLVGQSGKLSCRNGIHEPCS